MKSSFRRNDDGNVTHEPNEVVSPLIPSYVTYMPLGFDKKQKTYGPHLVRGTPIRTSSRCSVDC